MKQNDKHPIKSKIPVAKGKHAFECGGQTFVVDEKYEFIKQIGQGAYGVVCSAKNKKNGQMVAVKKIPNAFEDLVDAKRIVREIKLLKFFDHENIISLVDLPRPDAKTGFNDIYIITDLMGTDLHKVIYSSQALTDEHIQYFAYQMLRGLLYIHTANVIHRDLKPSNILLNKDCDLKICDLGLARGYESEEEFKTEYVITRWYRAPEVILNASEYTKAVDIYAAGCIIAELLGRTPLFPGEDYLDQVQRIISVLGTPTPDDMKYIGNPNAINYIKSLPKRTKQSFTQLYPKANPKVCELLTKMITFNPDKRYTVEQCLEHDYFDGLHNPEAEPRCDKVFDWSWDNFELKKETLQKMVYDESLQFNPVKF
ncbi:unnamed protein product [Paramecium octaurelia]|uniref:Mitogen-activated protein kinase n=1 Tax=Paramecium octaurelia TaxID=43137 RepID=A0A8S1VIK5_PAROT|nr:unnamed protein product [Paramecium octaurelia]